MAAPTVQIIRKGANEYQRALVKLSPKSNPKATSLGLRALALRIQRVSARDTILKGGHKGPAHPTKLTSRSGTGRRSIRVDLRGQPRFVEVGSDLGYMAVHERGGRVTRKASTVATHTRTVVFGRKVAPFRVPSFTRKAHSATFPRRAWLEPAIDRVIPTPADRIMAEFWERQVTEGST